MAQSLQKHVASVNGKTIWRRHRPQNNTLQPTRKVTTSNGW